MKQSHISQHHTMERVYRVSNGKAVDDQVALHGYLSEDCVYIAFIAPHVASVLNRSTKGSQDGAIRLMGQYSTRIDVAHSAMLLLILRRSFTSSEPIDLGTLAQPSTTKCAIDAHGNDAKVEDKKADYNGADALPIKLCWYASLEQAQSALDGDGRTASSAAADTSAPSSVMLANHDPAASKPSDTANAAQASQGPDMPQVSVAPSSASAGTISAPEVQEEEEFQDQQEAELDALISWNHIHASLQHDLYAAGPEQASTNIAETEREDPVGQPHELSDTRPDQISSSATATDSFSQPHDSDDSNDTNATAEHKSKQERCCSHLETSSAGVRSSNYMMHCTQTGVDATDNLLNVHQEPESGAVQESKEAWGIGEAAQFERSVSQQLHDHLYRRESVRSEEQESAEAPCKHALAEAGCEQLNDSDRSVEHGGDTFPATVYNQVHKSNVSQEEEVMEPQQADDIECSNEYHSQLNRALLSEQLQNAEAAGQSSETSLDELASPAQPEGYKIPTGRLYASEPDDTKRRSSSTPDSRCSESIFWDATDGESEASGRSSTYEQRPVSMLLLADESDEEDESALPREWPEALFGHFASNKVFVVFASGRNRAYTWVGSMVSEQKLQAALSKAPVNSVLVEEGREDGQFLSHFALGCCIHTTLPSDDQRGGRLYLLRPRRCVQAPSISAKFLPTSTPALLVSPSSGHAFLWHPRAASHPQPSQRAAAVSIAGLFKSAIYLEYEGRESNDMLLELTQSMTSKSNSCGTSTMLPRRSSHM